MPRSSPPPFFSGLPATGPWQALGLTRGQFLAILAISSALFLWIGGPLWQHLRGQHGARLTWSYLAIAPMVAASLWHNRTWSVGHLIAGTGAIALLKLLATAGLMVLLTLAR